MGNTGDCKIDIITDRYNLDSGETQYETIDEHLYARWVGADNKKAEGYRTLQNWFNKRILRRVYLENGRSTRQINRDHDILSGDDEILKNDLKDELDADGINSDLLVKSFVSWGTIRTHLKGCLDSEKEQTESKTNWERRSVDIASDIVEQKVEDALKSLSSKGKLKRGDEADINIQVQLVCPECPTHVTFSEALKRGFICPDHQPFH